MAPQPSRLLRWSLIAFVVSAAWPLTLVVLWLTTGEPRPLINVRWTPGITDEQRTRAERELSLFWHESQNPGTVAYFIIDASPGNLQKIVVHPLVEDTAHIDRATFVLDHPPSARMWLGDRFTNPLPFVLMYLSLFGCLITGGALLARSTYSLLGNTTRRTTLTLATRWIGFGAVWLAAFLVSVSSYTVVNDHFDRISRARQIVRYGELPFRDFFDPGYFMTELSSAALQLLFGDNLLGELLLNCVFIASGTVLVAALSWRISRSTVWAGASAGLCLLTFPRAYDFDKVLFYPLGIALCWHYVMAPTTARIWIVALGGVVAALYRYDNGLYIFGAAVAIIAVLHAGDGKTVARHLGALAAAAACLSLPVLVFLQFNGGVMNAADQVVTYARHEAVRTRVSSPPELTITDLVDVMQVPTPSQAVTVRWAPTVDESSRRAAEQRHGLSGAAPRGEPEDRTWRYNLRDSSASSLRSLLKDPFVEDTSGIDRDRLELTPDPLWVRAQRAVPLLRLRLLPRSWHAQNASTFLYYLLRLLPLVAALGLGILSAFGLPRAEAAQVTGIIVVCLALNLFILRDPVAARFGGMAGPTAILSVWLFHRIWRVRSTSVRRILKLVAVAVFLLTTWSISATANWRQRLAGAADPATVVRTVAASPPSPELIGGRDFEELVTYLRRCTRPTDRVLATWFVPELYFLAQRGFGAGLAVVFGAHWSEQRFVERSVQLLDARPATVIINSARESEFRSEYPGLASYLDAHYQRAGVLGQGSYIVAIRKDAASTSADPVTGMPCVS